MYKRQSKTTAAQVTFKYRVLKNGVQIHDESTAIAANSKTENVAVFMQKADGTTSVASGLIAGDAITVEIYDVIFTHVDMKYMEGTEDITAAMVKAGSAETAPVTAGTVAIKYPSADSTGTVAATVAGATCTAPTFTYAAGTKNYCLLYTSPSPRD